MSIHLSRGDQPPLSPDDEPWEPYKRRREPDDLAEAIYDAILAANRAYLAGLRQRPALGMDNALDAFGRPERE